MGPLQRMVRTRLRYSLVLRTSRSTDRAEAVLRKLSRDRIGVLDFVGLPSLRMTVAGRTTGVLRTCTLQYVDDGDGYLVVGSNWGRPGHPAWSENLLIAGRADVSIKGKQLLCTATLLTGAERERCWERVLMAWPSYRLAQEATARPFRLFRLEAGPSVQTVESR